MNDNLDEERTESAEQRKLFTLEEANATLPLVRAIVEDLAKLSRDVLDRRERLAAVPASPDRDGHDLYSEELVQIHDELERDTEELKGYVEELRMLGVEPKNGLEGIVDFPALMDGRVVYLCWQIGEPEVLHWHELDAGFLGRQPMTTSSLSSGSELSGSGSSDLSDPSTGA
jgi:hypothetical protein